MSILLFQICNIEKKNLTMILSVAEEIKTT